MKYLFIFLLAPFFLVHCTSSDQVASACYSFDLRQCNGDPWNEIPNQNNDEAALIASCKDFLESKGVTVMDIGINNSFHTIVCEACVVCPVGPRYFIKAPVTQDKLLNALMLLNFEIADCSFFQN